MNPLDVFQQLKNDVLLTYQKQYPYFEGNWKTFSSQDIQNLIDLIAVQVKQTVSEKWIYTHLKSETNDKLPRKDMLDILSQWVGYSGWDEYVFKNKSEVTPIVAKPKQNNKVVLSVGFFGLILLCWAHADNPNKKENNKLNADFIGCNLRHKVQTANQPYQALTSISKAMPNFEKISA